jgi:hypothetical protein
MISNQQLIEYNVYYHVLQNMLCGEYPDGVHYRASVTDLMLSKKRVEFHNRYAYVSGIRNWMFWGTGFEPIVKHNGAIVSRDNYTVDFRRGIVLFDETYAVDEIDDVTASFKYSTVAVEEGYPSRLDSSVEEQESLPRVAVEFADSLSTPLELGGGRERIRSVVLHIQAINSTQRDNISGMLEQRLEYSKPIVDYRNSLPMLGNGDVNPVFVAQAIGDGHLWFDDIRSRKKRVENPTHEQRNYSTVLCNVRSLI